MSFLSGLDELRLGPRLLRSQNADEEVDLVKAQKELGAEVATLAASLEIECFHIIFVCFPKKIKKLDHMFKNHEAFTKSSQQYGI